jgi:phage terminase large subunit
MANNPNAAANLKPFKKNDPRINRKGRPKSFDAFRELAQQIAHEAATKDRAPLVIDGHIVTITEAILRQWAQSKDARLQMAFVEAAYGKTPPPMDPALADKNTDKQRQITLPADVLAPSFLDVYRDIRDHKHTEYLFYGGRGSLKSTFVSEAIIWQLVNNPTMHAVVLRQVADTLHTSVYDQLNWAISELNNYYPGLADDFKRTTSPLEITYRPTGQTIYFRGADDPGKIKSIKPPFGYIGIAWFEELDQFHGPEAVRKIEQSAIRGGDLAFIFKSFNPPPTSANWANKYVKIPKATQHQHHSNYLDVPPEWLGKVFLEEAEHLRTVNPDAYNHEYMGTANAQGGTVFPNTLIRRITDEEIAQFDRIHYGLDWGYALDPLHWVKLHYDAARETIYLFDEFRAHGMGNRELYENLVEQKHMTPADFMICDSAEPKSIGDLKSYGLDVRGAEKGDGSVRYSMAWLRNRVKIIIDNERCPFAAQEFLDYEYLQTKDGEWISEYPDKNNHAIDAVRYALNLIWRRRGQ